MYVCVRVCVHTFVNVNKTQYDLNWPSQNASKSRLPFPLNSI